MLCKSKNQIKWTIAKFFVRLFSVFHCNCTVCGVNKVDAPINHMHIPSMMLLMRSSFASTFNNQVNVIFSLVSFHYKCVGMNSNSDGNMSELCHNGKHSQLKHWIAYSFCFRFIFLFRSLEQCRHLWQNLTPAEQLLMYFVCESRRQETE